MHKHPNVTPPKARQPHGSHSAIINRYVTAVSAHRLLRNLQRPFTVSLERGREEGGLGGVNVIDDLLWSHVDAIHCKRARVCVDHVNHITKC